MGDSPSQDLELIMPEKSDEIIIKPETIEKFQTTQERSRLNLYFRGTESKRQDRSASFFSSEPSFSDMTEMQEFSEETEKRFPRIQNRSASVLSSEPSNSEMTTEMQDFSEETEKRLSRIQNRSASVLSSEPSSSEMNEMQEFSELTPIRNLVSLMPENSEVAKEINPFQCKSCKNTQEIEKAEDCHKVSEIKKETNDFSNIAQRWQEEISDSAEYGNTGC